MSDNVQANAGSGGDLIAADDIGGVKHQRIKISQGADGSATDVSSAAPLQVTLANTGANTNKILTTPDLPSGASTAAKQPALGTAGTASTDVISVQGIASMTPLATSNATTSVVGNGAAATAQRVTLANDSTGIVALTTSTASIGKLAANSGVDIGDVDITTLPVAFNAGATSATTQRVILATDTTVPNVTGNIASGSADSGNPVKVGGRYNSSAPTLTNGQRGDMQLDANGNQMMREQYMPGYEDNTANKAVVEHRYTSSGVLTADTLVKSGAGLIHTITFSCNDAAPTAGSLILYDNTAESGTQIFNHTFTTTPFAPCTVTLDVSVTNGIYAGFTTTTDVNVVISYR